MSDLGRLSVEVSRSHTNLDTTQAIGLLWTSDQLVGQTSTCTAHNKHKGLTSMLSAGFEPTIPAIQRLQMYALDRTATGIGAMFI